MVLQWDIAEIARVWLADPVPSGRLPMAGAEGVVIRLSDSRVYAKDCLDCVVRDDTLLDRIDTQVQLTGALTDEQERKLMEVAHKCPVHRTLTSEVEIPEVTG